MGRLGVIVLLFVSSLSWAGEYDEIDDRFESENKTNQVQPPFDSPAAQRALEAKSDADSDAGPDEETIKNAERATNVNGLRQKVGQTLSVKGKVVSTFVPKSKTIFIMNFSKDFRQSFSVVIFKDDFEEFGGLDGLKKKFEGRNVLVNGIVSEHQGNPQIVLNQTSQISILKNSD